MTKKLSVSPYLIVLFCIMAAALLGQELNPSTLRARVLQGETYEYTFVAPDVVVVSEDNIGSGLSNVASAAGQEGLEFVFSYTTDNSFIGRSVFIIEQAEYINYASKQYTYVTIDVVPSLILAHPDYITSAVGVSSLVDVLQNDEVGFGASTITGLDLVSNGSAQIIGNSIEFVPEAGFAGTTSLNYFIEDAQGYKSTGTLSIDVQDGPLADGTILNYIITSGNDQVIFMDAAGYTLEAGTIVEGGSLLQINNEVFQFESSLTYEGTTSYTMVGTDGKVITIEILVIDNNSANDFVIDDVIYGSIGSGFVIDARANDLRPDGVLIDYSSDLVLLPDGTFSYVPPSGFSGVKNYYYTIFDGLKELRGEIEVYVGDYLPQLNTYAFTTKENTPVAMQYQAPIKDYTWAVINNPDHGVISVNVGNYSPATCDPVNGFRMAVYAPDDGWQGDDQLTLEYCVSNGACKQVDITITTVASSDACPCYGDDCVWSGDADNNGKVNIADLLMIGYGYGMSGQARSQTTTEWCANKTDDWNFDINDNGVNTKYSDANGDGIVNVLDTVGISANQGLYHNITAQEVLAEKTDILTPVPSSPTLEDGVTMSIDFILGTEENPVLDRQGLAFGIQLPEGKYDEGSVRFIPNLDWFGYGSPVISMYFTRPGYVEIGVVRGGVTSPTVSGFGSIGVLQITGENDMDGLRPEDEEVPIEVSIPEALVTDGSGKKYGIQVAPLQLIYKHASSDDYNIAPAITIYPNPSSEQVTFYADNNDELVDITIYSISGVVLLSKDEINAPSYKLSHDLPGGMYIASVKTQRGVVTEKIQVIK